MPQEPLYVHILKVYNKILFNIYRLIIFIYYIKIYPNDNNSLRGLAVPDDAVMPLSPTWSQHATPWTVSPCLPEDATT